MFSVMIFYQMSVITKTRGTTWNSEVFPPKYTAFQLESEIFHFPDGDGNKCGMGDVCQNLRPILNPKVNPLKIHTSYITFITCGYLNKIKVV